MDEKDKSPIDQRVPLTVLGEVGAALERSEASVARLAATLSTERATTRRFRVNLAVLLVLAVANLVGLGFAYRAADNAEGVARTLDDCLIVGGGCYERQARSGSLAGNRLMDFNACFFLIPPEDRTTADTERCRKEANDKFLKALREARK